ncbi:MAG: hypothetical protein IKU26_01150 [Clostridia bacterium]|nr:hypothetical protein [Clostridia bacterium]
MRKGISLRKILMLCMMMVFAVPMLFACGGGETPEGTPTARPVREPANNYKPNLIKADNKYADVAVYDKFGAWPQKSGDTYYGSQVGTWYTIWWFQEGHSSYIRWYGEDWTRVKPVDYGYYGSGDKDYATSVLVRMQYIGIDFMVLDDTNNPNGGYYSDIASNLSRFTAVADSLDGYSPKIAIATGGAIRDFGDAVQQQKDFDRYYKLYEKYPDAFYIYDGKPLLVMYMAGSPDVRYVDNQDRFTQRYGTGFISWQNRGQDQEIWKTQGNWGWVWDVQNKGSEIMGVQPGYNKAHQGIDIQYFERDNGVRYTQMWLEAIKENPRVIMIPSYNDHAEETGWEATVPIRKGAEGSAPDVEGEDPYVYEKITEAYLALRYGYIEGFFYKVEGTKQVYQCVDGYLEKVSASAPGKEPVILLPEGYIEWELNRDRG